MRQTPQARTRTRTSPGPGSGSARSTARSGRLSIGPGSDTTHARTAPILARAAAAPRFGRCDDPARARGLEQLPVIVLVAVRVGLGEVGERTVEHVTGAHIARDGGGVAGAGVCPGDRPRAELGVGPHPVGHHRLHRRGPLPVLQLAEVEVPGRAVDALHPLPSEEDVAGCLPEPLTGDHALALVRVLVRLADVLQHGRLGLLGLQEDPVGLVAAAEQQDPRAGADAADADDLACQVDEVVPPQQVAPLGRERDRVVAHELRHRLDELAAFPVREEVGHRHDQRRRQRTAGEVTLCW